MRKILAVLVLSVCVLGSVSCHKKPVEPSPPNGTIVLQPVPKKRPRHRTSGPYADGAVLRFDIRRANTQIDCELTLLDELATGEVTRGPIYAIFRDVAKAYKRPVPPHLYISYSSKFNNAEYIMGSAMPAGQGRGKIVISDTLTIDITEQEVNAWKGLFAHEMAHLMRDTSQHCGETIMQDPKEELAADALAAQTVGAKAVKSYLKKYKRYLWKIDYQVRMRALDKPPSKPDHPPQR